MKKSNKKALEQRGVILAGRAQNAPASRAHEDKRHLKRSTAKLKLQRELQSETARKRGPFDFSLLTLLPAFPFDTSHISE